jgi:hypothetical protein
MYFTTRTLWPGLSRVITVVRPTLLEHELVTCASSGPNTWCSIAAPTRSSERRVWWVMRAPWLEFEWCSGTSTFCSAAATRGSPSITGICSLAKSSDWMTSRAEEPASSGTATS